MRDIRIDIRNTGTCITMAVVALLTVLMCSMPARVSGDAVLSTSTGYKQASTDMDTDAAGAELDDYSLRVTIEDEPVPLSSGSTDYRGLVMPVVTASLLITLMTGYYIWFRGHKKRIASLLVMGLNGDVNIEGVDDVSILHPLRTVRFENELENQVVSSTAKGV